MPPATAKPALKRKASTFKPPRPASKSTKSPATRRKSAPTKRGRPSFIADQASASEDDGDQDEDEDQGDKDDEIPSDTHIPSDEQSDTSLPTNFTTNTNAVSSTQEPPPTIPPALLTKLLHHHFKDDKMRIWKEANGVVGKYMETFVREAIARAAFERSEAAGDGGVGGMSGDFLEVEDLEKLAPQLLLDF